MTVDGQRRQVEYVAAFAAVIDVGMFAFVGYFAFQNLLWGAVAGVLTGVGTYLFLPWAVLSGMATAEHGEEGTTATGTRSGSPTGGTGRGLHRPAAGIALAAGGLAVMTVGFAVPDDLLLAVLVAALVSVVAYLPLARLLPGV